ncbi:DedA family protein [Dactylosporangium sp. NPDC005555]|uniref:DedA family protein n=1 Tax=Dactylosporangium sp. NPDC005555 TaxID=3154889 RepID=UPI0033B4B7F4
MAHLVLMMSAMPVWAVYVVVTALAFGESAAFVGLVLPGETALLLGGVLAAAGRVSLPVMVAASVVAAVVGDSVGYEIGRYGGTAIRDSRAGRFVGADRWDRAEAYMSRRGGWAVFAGRWVGLMRALIPALAGMTRMPYRRFLLYNTAGGALWATTVVVAGYFAGASWQRVQTYLGHAGVVVFVVAASLATVVVAARRLARRRAGTPGDRPSSDR